MFDFTGRRIVITGAGGGVGQALTSAFGNLGGEIVACDVNGADIEGSNITETHHFDYRDKSAVTNGAQNILAKAHHRS